jgi:hypothetical protein
MKEKECKYCRRIIPAFAKVCPHCLKKQGLAWVKVLLISILTIVLLFLLLAAFVFIAMLSEKRLRPVRPFGTTKASLLLISKTSILSYFCGLHHNKMKRLHFI